MRDEDVLKDPQTSDWLKEALRAALACDPVRVANDALCLARLLEQRAARVGDPEARFPPDWIPQVAVTKKALS